MIQYKFKINGIWVVDPYRKIHSDQDYQNHYIDIVEEDNEDVEDQNFV